MDIIKPFPYLFGKETKDAFLKRHLLHYDAVKYVNATLPEDAVIFTMFLGRRGYYLDKNYKNESSFGMKTLKLMIRSSSSKEKFVKYIQSLNVTHIMMRTKLVDNYLKDNFSSDKIRRFMRLEKKFWKPVYVHNGYAVWDIRIKE